MIQRLPFDGLLEISQTFANVLFLKNSKDQTYNVYEQFGMKGHNGIDFGCKEGTPIYAPHDGVIQEATFDADGYGNYVKIENKEEGSVLAHLQKIVIKLGFEVKAGELIGYSGKTGNVTGPHLHWGYYTLPRNRANGYAGFIDQMPLIKNLLSPVKYNTKFNVGYHIKPSISIPTGIAPGKESFDYGKVSPDSPAKIIGITTYNNVAYYNIDQSPNGGTGWVRADAVDGDIKLLYKTAKEEQDAQDQTAKDATEFTGKIKALGTIYGFTSFAELENLLKTFKEWSKQPANLAAVKVTKKDNNATFSMSLDWLLNELGLDKPSI